MGIAPEVQFALDALLGQEQKKEAKSLPNMGEVLERDNEPSNGDMREFKTNLRKVLNELKI